MDIAHAQRDRQPRTACLRTPPLSSMLSTCSQARHAGRATSKACEVAGYVPAKNSLSQHVHEAFTHHASCTTLHATAHPHAEIRTARSARRQCACACVDAVTFGECAYARVVMRFAIARSHASPRRLEHAYIAIKVRKTPYPLQISRYTKRKHTRQCAYCEFM
jgi:hypothetical protein